MKNGTQNVEKVMNTRKIVTPVLLGWLTLTVSASAHEIELFTAERYDEVAALPGFSLGAPSGMVSSWGSYFVALGGLTNTPRSDRTDGSASVGMGLGDPIKSIGSTLSLSIGSVDPGGSPGERGSFAISVGKFFVGPQLGIAIGGINVTGWNDITVKPKSSIYLSATKVIPFEDYPVIITAGVGNNDFSDVQEINREDKTAAFAAIAAYLSPHISLIVDQTSGILTVGTSILPIADLPLVFTFGAFDVNKVVPNHNKVSFTGTVAYSFSF